MEITEKLMAEMEMTRCRDDRDRDGGDNRERQTKTRENGIFSLNRQESAERRDPDTIATEGIMRSTSV